MFLISKYMAAKLIEFRMNMRLPWLWPIKIFLKIILKTKTLVLI
jgi:hypothetical protein